MRINISEILANPSVIRQYKVCPEFEKLELTHTSYPVSYKEPFVLTVSNKAGRLLLEGETRVNLLMPCDRCLDEVEIPFPIHIDTRVKPYQASDGTSDAPDHDSSDSDLTDPDEYSFLDGCILDVDKLVSDEIVVALPTKVLCKEDCKGLCSVCGTNLNHSSCSCDRSVGDPRMAAIRDIFKEFNSDS